jgi:phosphomannomutase / phosphoglucomutase
LSGSEKTLAELDSGIPRLHSTPVLRPYCPPRLMESVLVRLREALSERGEVSTIDGIRVKFERGWGGVRASNTEPVLSMRFEGETEADAQHYQTLVFDILREFPEIKLEE